MSTGNILWQYSAGSSVNAAPAVVDGTVFWGSGYSKSAEGSGNNKLFAFSIPETHPVPPPPVGHPHPPSSWKLALIRLLTAGLRR